MKSTYSAISGKTTHPNPSIAVDASRRSRLTSRKNRLMAQG